jgi:hypothetical protein
LLQSAHTASGERHVGASTNAYRINMELRSSLTVNSKRNLRDMLSANTALPLRPSLAAYSERRLYAKVRPVPDNSKPPVERNLGAENIPHPRRTWPNRAEKRSVTWPSVKSPWSKQ